MEAIYLELVDLREDASFTLNKQYFNYSNSLAVTNGASDKLFGGPPRVLETELSQHEIDLGALHSGRVRRVHAADGTDRAP